MKIQEVKINSALEFVCVCECPWTARRSTQSILKEISPGCSLEGLMLMLKLKYFGHLMQRADSLEKTLMLGKIEGRRRRGWQRMRWLDGSPTQWTWVWVDSGSWDGQGGLACCGSWGCKESDTTEWLNWTEMMWVLSCSVMPDTLQLSRLWPARILCPWNFPGKNTGLGSHFLQEIFKTQVSNLHF